MVISPALVHPQAHTHCPDRARRADSGAGGGAAAPRGQYFLSRRKKVPKKAGGTATSEAAHVAMHAAKPCAALGLGYALHGFQPFLALVGLRPPLVAGFGLREPNGWMPRIYSGHPIPALRPEQSDHVPWADCPQGLSSTSVRCAHPPGKRLLLPILMAGLAMSRAMKLDSFHKLLERARARLFPPSK